MEERAWQRLPWRRLDDRTSRKVGFTPQYNTMTRAWSAIPADPSPVSISPPFHEPPYRRPCLHCLEALQERLRLDLVRLGEREASPGSKSALDGTDRRRRIRRQSLRQRSRLVRQH